MQNQFIFFLTDYWFQIVLTMLISYLLGSISFSIIVTKRVKKSQDIRSLGSGNAGFTNVLRSVGKLPAILTMVGDFGKGILAVLAGKLIFQSIAPAFSNEFVIIQYGAYLAGICCFLGHIYPCFFGFKGGKGVLTAAAMIFMIDWRVLCISLGLFLIMFFITKIVSLSAICAAVSYPIATFLITFFMDYYPSIENGADVPITYVIVATAAALFVAIIIVYKHKLNIQRLLSGTEKKITSSKNKAN